MMYSNFYLSPHSVLGGGVANAHSRLDTPRQIVSKWCKRFCLARLPGLEEEARGGRPARFSRVETWPLC